MRKTKLIAFTLRVVGTVILCLALVFTIYSACTSVGRWNQVKTYLTYKGVETGLSDRLRFDNAYFGALSAIARGNTANERSEDSVRKAGIAERFAFLEDGIADGEKRAEEEAVRKIYASYENTGLLDQILEHTHTLEDLQDEKDLINLYQRIDEASAIKKGKIALAVSYRDKCRAYFDDMAAGHEEDIGSFVEFSGAILDLYTEYRANGGNAAIDSFLSNEMTLESYQTALAAVRAAEKSEAQSNPMEQFEALVSARSAGENADFDAYFHETYAEYTQRYPEMPISFGRFAVCLNELLTNTKKDFFGTYEEIHATVLEENSAYRKTSFSSYMDGFLTEVLTDADNRTEVRFDRSFAYWHWQPIGSVGDFLLNLLRVLGDVLLFIPRGLNNLFVGRKLNIPAILWKQAEFTWLFWASGAILVLVSVIISLILNAYVLKRCRVTSRVEEDDSVLLRVDHLKQYFRSKGYVNKAVDDISFFIKKGEVFGLVGESGCGKTTTGRTIINLYDPTDGDVYFNGQRISTTEKGLNTLLHQLKNDYLRDKALCKRKIKQAKASGDNEALASGKEQLSALRKKYNEDTANAYIHCMESRIEKKNSTRMYRESTEKKLKEEFEKDVAGLSDPQKIAQREAVYKQQVAHLKKENIMTKMQMIFQDPIASINPRMTVREIIAEGLKIRGIKDNDYINKKVIEMLELVGLVPEHMDRYPHEFSGGQRQRIGIARAVIMEPDLIIADEPISALDVSIQAQVLNLLNELRENMGLTIMFIAHNLSVVKFFSDRIAVMYYGKIVEMTTSDELFAHPLHPYTKSLLSAIPYPDPEYEKNRKRITYNPAAEHDYSVSKPELREIVPGHFIYCNEPEFEKYKKELGLN